MRFPSRNARLVLPVAIAIGLCGCDGIVPNTPPLLFAVPLAIEGVGVGDAILDTGGAYEVLLRERFGLPIVATIDIIAFGGARTVPKTEGFSFTAGGVERTSSGAIVEASICGCNALGFHFLRNSGMVLALNFDDPSVRFILALPRTGVLIPFASGTGSLRDFDTAFIDVIVDDGDTSTATRALVDTGSTATLMRRDLLGSAVSGSAERHDVTLHHPALGTVGVSIGLFDTAGLPDIILGTDVMRVWGHAWYFQFDLSGGSMVITRPIDVMTLPGDAPVSPVSRVRESPAPRPQR